MPYKLSQDSINAYNTSLEAHEQEYMSLLSDFNTPLNEDTDSRTNYKDMLLKVYPTKENTKNEADMAVLNFNSAVSQANIDKASKIADEKTRINNSNKAALKEAARAAAAAAAATARAAAAAEKKIIDDLAKAKAAEKKIIDDLANAKEEAFREYQLVPGKLLIKASIADPYGIMTHKECAYNAKNANKDVFSNDSINGCRVPTGDTYYPEGEKNNWGYINYGNNANANVEEYKFYSKKTIPLTDYDAPALFNYTTVPGSMIIHDGPNGGTYTDHGIKTNEQCAEKAKLANAKEFSNNSQYGCRVSKSDAGKMWYEGNYKSEFGLADIGKNANQAYGPPGQFWRRIIDTTENDYTSANQTEPQCRSAPSVMGALAWDNSAIAEYDTSCSQIALSAAHCGSGGNHGTNGYNNRCKWYPKESYRFRIYSLKHASYCGKSSLNSAHMICNKGGIPTNDDEYKIYKSSGQFHGTSPVWNIYSVSAGKWADDRGGGMLFTATPQSSNQLSTRYGRSRKWTSIWNDIWDVDFYLIPMLSSDPNANNYNYPQWNQFGMSFENWINNPDAPSMWFGYIKGVAAGAPCRADQGGNRMHCHAGSTDNGQGFFIERF